MINQASTKDFKKAVILSGAFPREDLIRRHRRHPEASLFEAVRISSFIHISLSFSRDNHQRYKGTPPLTPPQWGNEFNNSPPWRGAVLRRGGCLFQ
jgi:hypothetical protein